MDDCVAAIAVPEAVTAYVRPSALVFTIEGGRHVLRVTYGREETLRLLALKRAKTRDERYDLSVQIADESVLPERSGTPTVTIATTNAVLLLMEAAFDVMPHVDRLQDIVYDDEMGLDAFVLPSAPEFESGFGVVRMQTGPLLEMFHSRQQAASFLKRHMALAGKDMLEEAFDDVGRTMIEDTSDRMPETFGGFAAAIIGTRYRVRRETRARLLKPR